MDADFRSGRVLGGSTSINFMITNKGSFEEYDRYAEITGDDSWSAKSIKPYLTKWEDFSSPMDMSATRTTFGQFRPSTHGYTGPVKVSLPNYHYEVDDLLLEAGSQTDGEIDSFRGWVYTED